MTTDYPAGTVAVATVRGVPNVRVMRSDDTSPRGGGWLSVSIVSGSRYHQIEDVTDVRPLVVLDLNGGRDIRYTIADLRDAAKRTRNSRLADIADQIEAQTRPPKPTEPTGLGAVVEDHRGVRWTRVRDGFAWRWRDDRLGEHIAWEHLAKRDVRILSEGVTQ